MGCVYFLTVCQDSDLHVYICRAPLQKGNDITWEKAKGQYGRVADAAKIIDPRKE